MNETEEKRSIRVGAYTVRSRDNQMGSCTIESLTPEEVEQIKGSINEGHQWIRRNTEGRLESISSYEALPKPVADERMHPFWQLPSTEKPVQMEMFTHVAEERDHSSPSITIQHLCGYGYTEEGYIRYGELLTSYGFECLRSQRGVSGQYWELWFLCGLWCAKGDLAEAIKISGHTKENHKLRVALNFLKGCVVFGTLDVSYQRLAMVMDD